jgi:hypothetical protein
METGKRHTGGTPQDTSLVLGSDATSPEEVGSVRNDTACVFKGEGTLSAEGKHSAKRVIPLVRVPVLAPDGEPLMPTKASRAKKWIREGKAKPLRTKLGLFAVQLIGEPSGRKKQSIVVGVDPGSSYTGIAVASKEATFCGFNLELPTHVSARMQHRSMMRRGRRYRKCRRRECRFLNRCGKKVAPGILARKQFELRVVRELAKTFPISEIVVEDVRFDHYNKTWGKNFSQVEVGKNWLNIELGKLAPIRLFDGWETKQKREELGLVKSHHKSARNSEAHVNDAIALCSLIQLISNTDPQHFDVIRRPLYSKRKLHLENPTKGGVRRKYGGTTTLFGFRKGDFVEAMKSGKIISGWVSGSHLSKNIISVSNFEWKRLGYFTLKKTRLIELNTHILLQHKGVIVAIPPPNEFGGILAT